MTIVPRCSHRLASSLFVAKVVGMHSVGTSRFAPLLIRPRCSLEGVAAARLLRAYATQVETLCRLRSGGSQVVRVEHVHVNEGGQALIGNVSSER